MKRKSPLYSVYALAIISAYCFFVLSFLNACNPSGSMKEMAKRNEPVRGKLQASMSQPKIPVLQASMGGKDRKGSEASGSAGGETTQMHSSIIHCVNVLEEQQQALMALRLRAFQAEQDLLLLNERIDWTMTRKAELQLELAQLTDAILAGQDKLDDVQLRLAVATEALLSGRDRAQLEQLTATARAEKQAYYITASSEELALCGVIDPTEADMENGAQRYLLNPTMEGEDFVQTEKYDDQFLPVSGYDPALASKHPAGSFEWIADGDGQVTHLHILDAERFWKDTQYLVIIVS